MPIFLFYSYITLIFSSFYNITNTDASGVNSDDEEALEEYQKWLEEHKGLSPLNDNSETLSFSLSDINPLLIKAQ